MKKVKTSRKIVNVTTPQKDTSPNPYSTCPELKKIPSSGYNFDDVIENVDRLLKYYFHGCEKKITDKVYRLSSKYAEQIDGDYDTFLDLVNSKRELEKWWITVTPPEPPLTALQHHILDLYFQINMVSNYDVYNDILIYAYLEDIQPLLN